MAKNLGQLVIVIFFVLIITPALVVGLLGNKVTQNTPLSKEKEPGRFQNNNLPLAKVVVVAVSGIKGKEAATIPLEEYLVGVVAAEMPAEFHLEALKAQAVAARSYSLRKKTGASDPCPQEGAHLCTDSTCCQAWIEPEIFYNSLRQENKDEVFHKIVNAVETTANQALTYQGQLIEAVYHSTCGGTTEASHALWEGNSINYLQPVDCSYCSHSPYYRQEIKVNKNDLRAAFLGDAALPVTDTYPQPQASIIEAGPGSRVIKMQVGEIIYSGPQVRQALELPSTYFAIQPEAGGIIFHLRGFGHGVGLCQYGADGMASEGYSYQEILSYYYPQTKLELYQP